MGVEASRDLRVGFREGGGQSQKAQGLLHRRHHPGNAQPIASTNAGPRTTWRHSRGASVASTSTEPRLARLWLCWNATWPGRSPDGSAVNRALRACLRQERDGQSNKALQRTSRAKRPEAASRARGSRLNARRLGARIAGPAKIESGDHEHFGSGDAWRSKTNTPTFSRTSNSLSHRFTGTSRNCSTWTSSRRWTSSFGGTVSTSKADPGRASNCPNGLESWLRRAGGCANGAWGER